MIAKPYHIRGGETLNHTEHVAIRKAMMSTEPDKRHRASWFIAHDFYFNNDGQFLGVYAAKQ